MLILHVVETYIARPKEAHASVAILLLTDVIGHRSNNAQLVADQYAANGYLTYMPDIFSGDALPLNLPSGFNIDEWKKNHTVEQTEPLLNKFIKHLREVEAAKRIGAAGYCFGAKYVIRGLGSGDVDVGYVAHPSFVTAEELSNIKAPLSIAAAGSSSFNFC